MDSFEEEILLREWEDVVSRVSETNSNLYAEELFSPVVIDVSEKMKWINAKAKKFYEEKRFTPAAILTPKQRNFRYGVNLTIVRKAGNVVEWYKTHSPQVRYQENVTPNIPTPKEIEKPKLQYPMKARKFTKFKYGEELRELRHKLMLQQKEVCILLKKKYGIELSQSVICRVESEGSKGVQKKVKKALDILLKELREKVAEKERTIGFGELPKVPAKRRYMKSKFPKPNTAKNELEETISQLKQQLEDKQQTLNTIYSLQHEIVKRNEASKPWWKRILGR